MQCLHCDNEAMHAPGRCDGCAEEFGCECRCFEPSTADEDRLRITIRPMLPRMTEQEKRQRIAALRAELDEIDARWGDF